MTDLVKPSEITTLKLSSTVVMMLVMMFAIQSNDVIVCVWRSDSDSGSVHFSVTHPHTHTHAVLPPTHTCKPLSENDLGNPDSRTYTQTSSDEWTSVPPLCWIEEGALRIIVKVYLNMRCFALLNDVWGYKSCLCVCMPTLVIPELFSWASFGAQNKQKYYLYQIIYIYTKQHMDLCINNINVKMYNNSCSKPIFSQNENSVIMYLPL